MGVYYFLHVLPVIKLWTDVSFLPLMHWSQYSLVLSISAHTSAAGDNPHDDLSDGKWDIVITTFCSAVLFLFFLYNLFLMLCRSCLQPVVLQLICPPQICPLNEGVVQKCCPISYAIKNRGHVRPDGLLETREAVFGRVPLNEGVIQKCCPSPYAVKDMPS